MEDCIYRNRCGQAGSREYCPCQYYKTEIEELYESEMNRGSPFQNDNIPAHWPWEERAELWCRMAYVPEELSGKKKRKLDQEPRPEELDFDHKPIRRR